MTADSLKGRKITPEGLWDYKMRFHNFVWLVCKIKQQPNLPNGKGVDGNEEKDWEKPENEGRDG